MTVALRDFLINRREIFSLDGIEVVRLTSSLEVGVVLMRGTARSKRAIRSSELAAAMIAFCLKQRIPLPHKADKSLRRAGDGVALSFSQGIGAAEFDLVLHSGELAEA